MSEPCWNCNSELHRDCPYVLPEMTLDVMIDYAVKLHRRMGLTADRAYVQQMAEIEWVKEQRASHEDR
jgi:hypothetical protein